MLAHGYGSIVPLPLTRFPSLSHSLRIWLEGQLPLLACKSTAQKKKMCKQPFYYFAGKCTHNFYHYYLFTIIFPHIFKIATSFLLIDYI